MADEHLTRSHGRRQPQDQFARTLHRAVEFRVAGAGHLAAGVQRRLAVDRAERLALLVRVLLRGFGIDDLLTGAEATEVVEQSAVGPTLNFLITRT